MVKKIIPDAYTEYQDGSLGVVPASLANVEAKFGAALGGIPGKVYTLSGADAKETAKTIFKGGPLLKAIEEAFNAGSSRMYAMRIGTPERAAATLAGLHGGQVLDLLGDYGSSGNNQYLTVRHEGSLAQAGHVVVFGGSPCMARVYNAAFEQVREINLTTLIPNLTGLLGVAAPLVARNTSHVTDFWILGIENDGGSVYKVWHISEAGAVVTSKALTGLVPDGALPSGIVSVPLASGDGIEITSTMHSLLFEITEGGLVLTQNRNLRAAGITNSDVEAADRRLTFSQVLNDDHESSFFFVLDKTSHSVVRFNETNESSLSSKKSLALATWLGTDAEKGLAVDPATGHILVVIAGIGSSRVIRLAVNWDAVGGPSATLVDSIPLPGLVDGIGSFVADGTVRTTLTVEDRNFTPASLSEYEVEGKLFEVLAALAGQLNDAGHIAATVATGQVLPLKVPPMAVQFTGGGDGGALTNQDYLDGLAATEVLTDVSWIHAIGATSEALWTAILLHCDQMLKLHKAERFAILETPAFVTAATKGSAAYLTDLQTYVDGLVTRMEAVADRNAVVFAGQGKFLGSDGVVYENSIASACGGTMAGLEVQKSLINKQVKGLLELVPEFTPGHLETLIQARCNTVRFKPGRGFVIVHSLTGAAKGSDYSRVNDLRAVYYGSKAAREASQLYVGEENDAAGEGLRRLESAMSRPLEEMKNAGQIDEYELSAVSTPANRLLGEVHVSLGIQPRRAMEMIYTTVYLK